MRSRRWLLLAAGFPLFQFFTGCSPNIPGLPNVAGAISVELQSLLTTTLVNAFSTLVSNVLNL